MSYPEFYNSIPQSLDHLKSLISQGISSRHTPFRTMNLCYIKDNTPVCRTVVIRQSDPDLSFIQCHSDYRSPKIKALMQHNQVAFHCYDSTSKVQLSMNGTAKVHYQDAITEQSWDKTQILSRRCYLSPLAPSSLITEPSAGFDPEFINNTQTKEDTHIGYDNFAVIRVHLHQIDYLYLHKHGNRRIVFTKNKPMTDSSFDGTWCIP